MNFDGFKVTQFIPLEHASTAPLAAKNHQMSWLCFKKQNVKAAKRPVKIECVKSHPAEQAKVEEESQESLHKKQKVDNFVVPTKHDGTTMVLPVDVGDATDTMGLAMLAVVPALSGLFLRGYETTLGWWKLILSYLIDNQRDYLLRIQLRRQCKTFRDALPPVFRPGSMPVTCTATLA